MPETNRVEHKEKLTKDLDLEKEVVAFLNYPEGGLIYLGIDNSGKILGVLHTYKGIDADLQRFGTSRAIGIWYSEDSGILQQVIFFVF